MNDDSDDLEVLHRLLCGELDETDPAARALLATPEGRRRLAELRRVRDRVERAVTDDSDDERRLLDLVESARRDPLRSEKLESFREFARAAAPPVGLRGESSSTPSGDPGVRTVRGPSLWRTGGLLAAAAVVLIVAIIGLRTTVDRGSTAPDVVLLGTGQGTLVQPLGPVAAYASFRWTLDLPRDGTYLLQIWDDDREGGAPIEIPYLTHPSWSPGERGAELPRRLRWRVTASDEFDVVRGVTQTGRAWLEE